MKKNSFVSEIVYWIIFCSYKSQKNEPSYSLDNEIIAP